MPDHNRTKSKLAQLPDSALAPLTCKRRWVLWRFNSDGKKQPRQINGRAASINDPDEWCFYEEAVEVLRDYDGLGFVLGAGIAAIDIDKCFDDYWPKARKIIADADSYTELSPSRNGVHVLGYGYGETFLKKYGHGEVFRGKGYVTITGRVFGKPRALRNIDQDIDALVASVPAPRSHSVAPVGKVNGHDRGASLMTVRAILDRHDVKGWARREVLRTEPTRTQSGQGRSAVHWKLACELHEAGVPADRAFVCLWETGWNKHSSDKPVWDMIDKIWE